MKNHRIVFFATLFVGSVIGGMFGAIVLTPGLAEARSLVFENLRTQSLQIVNKQNEVVAELSDSGAAGPILTLRGRDGERDIWIATSSAGLVTIEKDGKATPFVSGGLYKEVDPKEYRSILVLNHGKVVYEVPCVKHE